jgi:predicted peptidase
MPFQTFNAGDTSYAVFRPKGSSRKPLPAILFLHGKGESGSDGRQVKVGLPPRLLARPEDWPFLVVCPQKPDADRLWPDHVPLLAAVLADVDARFRTDPARRYLTGLSQGGNGTMTLATALPWRFAAIAPVCGWADPMRVARQLKGIPTWLFHGTHDAIVPASCSKAIADCMVRPDVRGDDPAPRLTLYPGVGHNAWDAAYAEAELPAWLLSHRLPG